MLNFDNSNLIARHFHTARALQNAGRIDEALAVYRQALALGPPTYELLNNLARYTRDLESTFRDVWKTWCSKT